MNLLPKFVADNLPPIGSTEWIEDPQVVCKFFTPTSRWTWYAIEFDGKDMFYGFVVGHEREFGYFSLSELSSAKGPLGLGVERDSSFEPKPLSQVKKLHE